MAKLSFTSHPEFEGSIVTCDEDFCFPETVVQSARHEVNIHIPIFIAANRISLILF